MEMRADGCCTPVPSEYAGPIAWLKGGKGGGSSTTNISSEPDQGIQCPAWLRLRNVSKAFPISSLKWWQDVQAPVEKANAEANLGLSPYRRT